MEKVAEAKAIIVKMICDKCKDGIMEYNPKRQELFQVNYPHICEKCGYEENYPFRYPFHKLVPIEPLREPTENEI